MVTVNESRHAGEHIVSEAHGTRSREQGVLASGENLVAGAVVGRITANGNFVAVSPGASDGSEVAAGILFEAKDASAEASPCLVHVRDCEVDADAITWPDAITAPEQAAATAQLVAAGIILR